MNNLFATIIGDMSSCLAGPPVALMISNTFLLNSKAAIDSMLIWMKSFSQKIKGGGGNMMQLRLGV